MAKNLFVISNLAKKKILTQFNYIQFQILLSKWKMLKDALNLPNRHTIQKYQIQLTPTVAVTVNHREGKSPGNYFGLG
jgi:hypothetical protein